jgi:protein-glucosylgalactosylhydroxylysine glucosidase
MRLGKATRQLYSCALWIALSAASCALLSGADGSFQLEALSPQPYTASYLGNGAMGLQTSPLGTQPTQCFVAGVYDHTPGDVQRIASAPAWNEIDIYNGSRWLNATKSFEEIENYHQVLDMYDAVVQTNFRWKADGRTIDVNVKSFVSRDDPEIAATRVTIHPQFAGVMRIRLPLRNWPAPHRYLLERVSKLEGEAARNQWAIWYPGRLNTTGARLSEAPDRVTLSLSTRAPGTETELGEAVTATWNARGMLQPHRGQDGAEEVLTVDGIPGASYVFTKYAALSVPTGSATQKSTEAERTGWDTLLAAHEAAWHRIWQSDIEVDGDAQLQSIVHSTLFYLLESVREDSDLSMPPMGLSSAGYLGHVFWDADTYIFPALVILHPEMARPLVAFRARTREIACQNAKSHGYKGAMYPWEAGPDGRESTPRFAYQNALFENHVNGDIALAVWQYWLATGDKEWLQQDCWPILRDTANFWVSRVNWDAKRKQYEIGKVVAVNESLIGVSNDAWTNSIAKMNLELADTAARKLHYAANPKWQQVAEKMYLPDDDSPLLRYPLESPWNRQKVLAAIQSEERRVARNDTGAMMGTEFYPILAAEMRDRSLIGRLVKPLVIPYLRPPFQVIAETPRNQNINFLTGAGAFVQEFVFGYTGLRLGENGLEQKWKPMLPPTVSRIVLKNVTIRGERRSLVFESSSN